MNAQVSGVVPQAQAAVVMQLPTRTVMSVEERHTTMIREATTLSEVVQEELTEEQIAQMEVLVKNLGDHLKHLRLQLSMEGKTGT